MSGVILTQTSGIPATQPGTARLYWLHSMSREVQCVQHGDILVVVDDQCLDSAEPRAAGFHRLPAEAVDLSELLSSVATLIRCHARALSCLLGILPIPLCQAVFAALGAAMEG
jgi:hypothetical protein